jgi:hypothetical protein
MTAARPIFAEPSMNSTRTAARILSLLALTAALPSPAQVSTMTRAETPTMLPDQSGCATITYYDVGAEGSGHQYTALKQLPWSRFKGCDTVRIHARPTPYYEMILASAGTDIAPASPTRFMRIIGVPDPATGALPIIDGTNATQLETLPGQAPRSLQYYENNNAQENRALYRLGLVTVSAQYGRTFSAGPAGYLSIENLEIRNANFGEPFIDGKTNSPSTYVAFTACLNVEAGAHLVLKNNILHNCGNGLFINSKNGGQGSPAELSQDILVEGNWFYGNSVLTGVGGSGGYSEHNSYSEARGIIFQYNAFGDIKPGAHGDCLKDRSSGLIVRYNHFASNCGIPLHLVDATGGVGLIYDEPDYATTRVYGNVFDVPDRNTTLLSKYGGDSGIEEHYRKGTYFFYNNTVVVRGNATSGAYATVYLFRLSDAAAVVEARNNVFYTPPTDPDKPGKVMAVSIENGTVNLANNWISPNAAPFWLGHLVPGAVVNGWDSNLVAGNNDPGFVDHAQHDFSLLGDSPLIDSGIALSGAIVAGGNHPTGVAGFDTTALRSQDAHIDVGAFEYVSGEFIFANGFE